MTVQEMINETLGDWTKQFLQHRIEDIRKVNLIASKELLNSLATDVQKATTDQLAAAFIAFEPYGRYFDMKRLKKSPVGREYIKDLEAWIRKLGIGKFKTGFVRKNALPKSNAVLINKIAWGIARSKKRRKRRRWYARSREEDIDLLYSMLLNGYQKTVLEDIKNTAHGHPAR